MFSVDLKNPITGQRSPSCALRTVSLRRSLPALLAAVVLLAPLAGAHAAEPDKSLQESETAFSTSIVNSTQYPNEAFNELLAFKAGIEEAKPMAGPPFAVNHCRNPIRQSDILPDRTYVIDLPGVYCLAEDIKIAWSRTRDDAILIRANDVELWFAGHSLSTQWGGNTGVRIEAGTQGVLIHHGSIEGFQNGIHADGSPTQPIRSLVVREMHFDADAGNGPAMWSGVESEDAIESSIEWNTFNDCWFGIVVRGAAWETVVRDNEIHLTSGDYGIFADGTQGLVIRDNRIIGDDHNTWPIQEGITLVSTAVSPSDNNIVESNLLTGVDIGIVVDGVHQRGANNTVRFNDIHAGSPAYGPQYPPPPLVQAEDDLAGILVGQQNVTIHDNFICSGATKGFYYGIDLVASAWGPANVVYDIYDNETCAVVVPLEPPAGVLLSQVDNGGNVEVCQPGVAN